MPHARRLPLLLLLAAGLTLPAAPASAKIQIGISEHDSNMFANPYFAPLKIKYARLVVPWNVLTRKDYWRERLPAWLNGAAAMGVEPHIAFNIACLEPKCFNKGPNVKRYTRIVKRFRKTYPQVRVFTPWNEANHAFQPTARRPKLAAQYYKALRRNCKGCKVLAADVLDDANLTKWMRKFKRYYNGRATWGLHNYQDANKKRKLRASWTYKMTRMVKGDIWSTEAGGLVGFKTVKGRVAYKYSLKRQRTAQRHLFRLMSHKKTRFRYKRVYIYRFYGTWNKGGLKLERWDSGLLNVNGKPRPAYHDLRKQIARNAR